jgi:hypothetical protein
MSLTAKDLMAGILSSKEGRILKAAMKVYGDDVSAILNGLHALAVRLAIAADVSPDDFAAGMKHHWDFVAKAINDYAEKRNDAHRN